MITVADLETPTPYNTYTIDGLPPGPIANPGRASLEAVANPSRTRDLFFVADGTGGHAFAETYEEHLRNVARWRADRCRADGRRPTGDEAAPPTVRRTAPPRNRPAGRGRLEEPMALDGARPVRSRTTGCPPEASAPPSIGPGLGFAWGRLANGA